MKNRGFAVMEVLLVALVLTLIGVAVYQSLRVRSLQNELSATSSTSAHRKPTPTPAPLVYSPQHFTCDAQASYKVAGGAVPAAAAAGSSDSMPEGGVSGIMDISAKCGKVLLFTSSKNVSYSFCSTLSLNDSAGAPAKIDAFTAGTYVKAGMSGTCVASMQVVPTPSTCGGGYNGGASVFFVTANAQAHTVVYQPTGGTALYAERLCPSAAVSDKDKSAIELSNIKEGTPVQLLLNGSGFITSVTVLKDINATP